MSDTYTTRPDLAGKDKDVVRDVKAKASDLTDGVTRAAKDNASQLGDAALDMANSAKDKVEAAVSQRKSLGADDIGSIAQATGRAATAICRKQRNTSAMPRSKSRVSRTRSENATCVNSSAKFRNLHDGSRLCSSAARSCSALPRSGF